MNKETGNEVLASNYLNIGIEMVRLMQNKIPNEYEEPVPQNLDDCPRCGEKIEEIIWGMTNCPRCSLHFECC